MRAQPLGIPVAGAKPKVKALRPPLSHQGMLDNKCRIKRTIARKAIRIAAAHPIGHPAQPGGSHRRQDFGCERASDAVFTFVCDGTDLVPKGTPLALSKKSNQR